MKNSFSFLLLPISVFFLVLFSAQASAQTLTLPAGLTEIGEEAFYNTASAEEIVIPAGVETIGQAAFRFSKVKRVTLPSSLKEIQKYAFCQTSELEEVELPEGLLTLGGYAFGFSGLKRINLPSSLNNIDATAFNGTDVCVSAEEGTYAYAWATVQELLPSIAVHPADVTVRVPQVFTLSVTARGIGLTYKWECSTDFGVTWVDAVNVFESSLTMPSNVGYNQCWFRCVVTDKYSHTVYSKPAVVTAAGAPRIIIQPEEIHIAERDPCAFSVIAEDPNGGELYYQWEYCTNIGAPWVNCNTSSSNTETQNLKPALDINGYYFRCTIKNDAGYTTRTNPVRLNVYPPATITQQPANCKMMVEGVNACFEVIAEGYNLSYQWQYSEDGGVTWTDSTAWGYDTPSLRILTSAANAGWHVRCVVTDGFGYQDISIEAILTIEALSNYRALLIGETRFAHYDEETDSYHIGYDTMFQQDVYNVKNMLENNVTGPGGGRYSVATGINVSDYEIKNLIIGTFRETTENDVSLFMISTHGLAHKKDANGHILQRLNGDLWMPYMGTEEEANDPDLRSSFSWKDSRGIVQSHTEYLTFANLANMLKTYVKGEVIVIINSCGSGASIYGGDAEQNSGSCTAFDPDAWNRRAIKAFSAADPGITSANKTGELRIYNKFYVLTSSRYGENGYGNASDGCWFIRCLVQGVGSGNSSPADANGDGAVNLTELFNYIRQFDGQAPEGADFYDDWYGEQVTHVQRYPASGFGIFYKLFTFER